MKKSSELDVQKLSNIIRSISNIEKCFERHEIINANNLKNDEVAQAACTQFITNIYADKSKLQDETYTRLTELNKIRLAGARHIASHDYDSLNFVVIFSICKQLTTDIVVSELQELLKELKMVNGYD